MQVRRTQRGLTFIEVMVVIVILGILIALVLPNLSGPRAKMELRTSVRDIAAAGMLARQRAIIQGVNTFLILDPEEGQWRIYTTPPDEDSRQSRRRDEMEPSTPEEMIRHFPPRVTILGIKTDDTDADLGEEQRLVFYPNGTCSGMAIQIKNSRDKSMTVDFEGFSGLPSVYTGEPKSFAAKLKENGLNPADYGIPDDTMAAAASRAGEGFRRTAGMNSEERVAYYANIAERLKERAEKQYRIQQQGVGAYYSEASRWGN